ncbi:hypothetical protein N184_29170 [Sinorhizobium sp. GL28]|nr:hypothetical protein N184_29170 [Sinorhizobium sp. GL28]
MPLIEVFDHFDLPAVEVKSSDLFDTTFVHKGFDLNLHDALAVLLG